MEEQELPWERNKFERLARYIARPAIFEQRLSLTSKGLVRYELKTPYRDGTTLALMGLALAGLEFQRRKAA